VDAGKILQKFCDFSGKGLIFGKKFENFLQNFGKILRAGGSATYGFMVLTVSGGN
jgi:hypothetical protein